MDDVNVHSAHLIEIVLMPITILSGEFPNGVKSQKEPKMPHCLYSQTFT